MEKRRHWRPPFRLLWPSIAAPRPRLRRRPSGRESSAADRRSWSERDRARPAQAAVRRAWTRSRAIARATGCASWIDGALIARCRYDEAARLHVEVHFRGGGIGQGAARPATSANKARDKTRCPSRSMSIAAGSAGSNAVRRESTSLNPRNFGFARHISTAESPVRT